MKLLLLGDRSVIAGVIVGCCCLVASFRIGSLLELSQLLQGLDLQKTVSKDLSALSPKSWPFGLEWLPAAAYLVGGSVRDALLGRSSDYLDLDFVLPDQVVSTAQAIARHYQAGFVLLDAERQIARVVFPQGTVDFAQQVGPTLEADLRRRDFTVNAIAYNPHCDRFVDPLRGCVDLEQRQIRMVSAGNLAEDPLRLLRAYRQAAQLGFGLDPETQAVIRTLAPSLQRIAAERIQSELNYLLSSEQGTCWLTQAWADGVLAHWLPLATEHSLELIAGVDRATILLQETHPAFAKGLLTRGLEAIASPLAEQPETLKQKASGSARNWLVTAKLACLLPTTPAGAESQLRHLKYSRVEVQSVATVLRSLPVLQRATGLETAEGQPVTWLEWPLREQYFFFQAVGAAFPAVVVLAIAQGVPLEFIAPLIQRFLTPNDPVAHSQPLVSGQALMASLQLAAGPIIGQLLAAIQLAQAEGTIQTQAEAIHFAKHLVQQGTLSNPHPHRSQD